MEPQNVTFYGNRVLADVTKAGIKMRFYWVSRSVRRPCEDGFRDWIYTATCQGTTGATRR